MKSAFFEGNGRIGHFRSLCLFDAPIIFAKLDKYNIAPIGFINMRFSPESLTAFVEAAAQGSFSGAARRLKKSQSTISIAIANLESDLGVTLFDRSGRQPVLNEAGQLVLVQVTSILAASDRLEALAVRLAGHIEPLLSVVMSDVYNFVFRRDVMEKFGSEFPDTELQCGPSEGADVISLIQDGHAHIGILAAQLSYPPDVAVARLPLEAEFGLYVSPRHRLAKSKNLQLDILSEDRQLCLKTYTQGQQARKGMVWSAPDYLSLLEFAAQGFGWAELPRALVHRFGRDVLVELQLTGYPRKVDVDVVWSRRKPLGPAGQWFLHQLQHLV